MGLKQSSCNPTPTASASSSRPTLLSKHDILSARQLQIVKEIVSTEATYVKNLRFVVENFLIVVRRRSMLEPSKIKVIFCMYDGLLAFHSDFLKKLENSVKDAIPSDSTQTQTAPLRIGNIFLEMSSFFPSYSEYCSNYSFAMKVAVECQQSSATFAELCTTNRNLVDSHRLALVDFLIMPVQRIPRYVLLLSDLTKHTPKRASDYRLLNTALTSIENAANLVNLRMREKEDREALSDLALALGKIDDVRFSSKKTSRDGSHNRIVKKDLVTIRGKKSKRYLFLLSQVLLVAKITTNFLGGDNEFKVKKNGDVSNETRVLKKLKCTSCVFLSDMSVTPCMIQGDAALEFEWIKRCPDPPPIPQSSSVAGRFSFRINPLILLPTSRRQFIRISEEEIIKLRNYLERSVVIFDSAAQRQEWVSSLESASGKSLTVATSGSSGRSIWTRVLRDVLRKRIDNWMHSGRFRKWIRSRRIKS